MGRSSLMVAVFSVFIFQCIPCAFSQQASVSPSVLSFAPQVVNLLSPGSQPQTVTLTNTGNSELIVSSVLASGGYKQTNNCSTLSSQQTCTIAVSFAPGTVETINGAITINDNAQSSPGGEPHGQRNSTGRIVPRGGQVWNGCNRRDQPTEGGDADGSAELQFLNQPDIHQRRVCADEQLSRDAPGRPTLHDSSRVPSHRERIDPRLARGEHCGGGKYSVAAFGGPRGRRFRECCFPGVSATCQSQFRQQRGTR